MKISAGECIGLSGESGCGKSRLLRALADMDPHAGCVALDGVLSNDLDANEWRKQVTLLPAESQWWFDSVGDHFVDAIGFGLLGFSDDALSWQVSRCSSGEKQRLAILRCLANRPTVLLLDEPTANLDPDNTARVEQLVKRYLKQNRALCIWVSHDSLQLERMAIRRYEMIDGEMHEVK